MPPVPPPDPRLALCPYASLPGQVASPSTQERTFRIREINPGSLLRADFVQHQPCQAPASARTLASEWENSFVSPQLGGPWGEGEVGSGKSNSPGLRIEGFKSLRGSTAFRFMGPSPWTTASWLSPALAWGPGSSWPMLFVNFFISLMPCSPNLWYYNDEAGWKRVIHARVTLTMKFIEIKFLPTMSTTSWPVPVWALGLGLFGFYNDFSL